MYEMNRQSVTGLWPLIQEHHQTFRKNLERSQIQREEKAAGQQDECGIEGVR